MRAEIGGGREGAEEVNGRVDLGSGGSLDREAA